MSIQPKKKVIDDFKRDTEAVNRLNRLATEGYMLVSIALDKIQQVNDELLTRGLLLGETKHKSKKILAALDEFVSEMNRYVPTKAMKEDFMRRFDQCRTMFDDILENVPD